LELWNRFGNGFLNKCGGVCSIDDSWFGLHEYIGKFVLFVVLSKKNEKKGGCVRFDSFRGAFLAYF
jgi:hypothetical protein